MATVTEHKGVFTHVDDNGNEKRLFPLIKTDTTLKVLGDAADAKATGDAIDTLKKSVSDGKTTVAGAITAAGVSTASNATYATMAANIATVATNRYNAGVAAADARANVNSTNYKTGYNAGVSATKVGTAGAAQVLSGYTFTNASSVGASGSMTNRGAWTGSISTSGGSATIPAGYHNGSGKVTGPTLATLVGSNVTLASAANLASGVTAYGKSGTKYTGSHTCPTLASLIGSNVTLASAANLASGVTAYGKSGTKYTGAHVCSATVKVGSFTNVQGGVTITVGFQPVFVMCYQGYSTQPFLIGIYSTSLGINASLGTSYKGNTFTITSTGFSWYGIDPTQNGQSGVWYTDTVYYIAYK